MKDIAMCYVVGIHHVWLYNACACLGACSSQDCGLRAITSTEQAACIPGYSQATLKFADSNNSILPRSLCIRVSAKLQHTLEAVMLDQLDDVRSGLLPNIASEVSHVQFEFTAIN